MGGEVTFLVKEGDRHDARVVPTSLINPLCRDLPFLTGQRGAMRERWERLERFASGPCDYGLVAIDRDSRWVGYVQNYTHVNRFEPAVLTFVESEQGALRQALEGKAVRRAWIKNGLSSESVLETLERLNIPNTFEALMQRLLADQRREYEQDLSTDEPRVVALSFEPPGWCIQAFLSEQARSWPALAQALVDRGFCFGAADEAEWNSYTEARQLLSVNLLAKQAAHQAVLLSRRVKPASTVTAPRGRL